MDNVRLSSLPPGLLPPLESGQQRLASRTPAVDDRPVSAGEDRLTLSAEGRARASRDAGSVVENVALPADRPGVQAYRQEAERSVAPPPLPQGDVYEGVFQRLNELAASLTPPEPPASTATEPAAPTPTEPVASEAGVPSNAPTIPATQESTRDNGYAQGAQTATPGSRVDVFA